MPEETVKSQVDETAEGTQEQPLEGDEFIQGSETTLDLADQLQKALLGEVPEGVIEAEEEPAEPEVSTPEDEEVAKEAVEQAAEAQDEEFWTEEEFEQALDEYLEKVEGSGEIPEEYQQAKQFVDMIQSNPEMYAAFLDSLKSTVGGRSEPQGAHEQQEAVPRLEIPDVPKPEDFDPTEAFDPNTPSGRWVYSQIAKQIAGSLSPVLEEVTKKVTGVEQFINTLQQREVQQQQQQQVQTVLAEFFGQHKEAEPYADDFIKFLTDPNDITLEDMWEFFKMKNGIAVEKAKQVAREVVNREPPQAPPASAVGGRAGKAQPKSFGDMLTDFLIGNQQVLDY